ncbi:MAG: hypothetical protein WC123_07905 [Bacilli bacterium]
MNGENIEQLNANISYEEGKIYWDYCQGYTSELIKRLLKSGYIAVKAGAIYILKNPENEEIITGYSWPGLLFNTAKLFV